MLLARSESCAAAPSANAVAVPVRRSRSAAASLPSTLGAKSSADVTAAADQDTLRATAAPGSPAVSNALGRHRTTAPECSEPSPQTGDPLCGVTAHKREQPDGIATMGDPQRDSRKCARRRAAAAQNSPGDSSLTARAHADSISRATCGVAQPAANASSDADASAHVCGADGVTATGQNMIGEGHSYERRCPHSCSIWHAASSNCAAEPCSASVLWRTLGDVPYAPSHEGCVMLQGVHVAVCGHWALGKRDVASGELHIEQSAQPPSREDSTLCTGTCEWYPASTESAVLASCGLMRLSTYHVCQWQLASRILTSAGTGAGGSGSGGCPAHACLPIHFALAARCAAIASQLPQRRAA